MVVIMMNISYEVLMKELCSGFCLWLNGLPDYYQAAVISFLGLTIMSQALDLGKGIGIIVYRVIH